jgi:tetraacyldisaccharide 4'-kinase
MNRGRLLLLPFSLIYFFITGIRNLLYTFHIFSSKKFPVPVISVGNITVGGTGKTPHTELLVEILKDEFFLAILSRGYKRKSKGFVLAGKKVRPEMLGDESYQISQHYKNIAVAVCENRVKGINTILKIKRNTQVIILDDSYQHRRVQPGMSILLVDYNRPIFKDFLLPAGNLRESWLGKYRADIIIITKTPEQIDASTTKYWSSKLQVAPHQQLFFTHFSYGEPVSVFRRKIIRLTTSELISMDYKLLVVTGIAYPKPLMDYLNSKGLSSELLAFPDHHEFSKKDIRSIREKFNSIDSINKIILTTEKDSVRFHQLHNLPEEIVSSLFYIPVHVEFSDGKRKDFETMIKDYVQRELSLKKSD